MKYQNIFLSLLPLLATPIWEILVSVTLGFYWGREKCEFANCDCIKSFLAFINALTSFIEENLVVLSSPSQKSWTGTEKSMWKNRRRGLAFARCTVFTLKFSTCMIANPVVWLGSWKSKHAKRFTVDWLRVSVVSFRLSLWTRREASAQRVMKMM